MPPKVNRARRNNCPKRLAPRSILQYKIGPQFSPTRHHLSVVGPSGEFVQPRLEARVDRGFDNVDGQWIGYKRNYITVVAAFQLEGNFDRDAYLVCLDTLTPVKAFHLRLIAHHVDSTVEMGLTQHTAKRDRGPQYQPPVYAAVPSELPSHTVISRSANIRNPLKIHEHNRIFFAEIRNPDPGSVLATYPKGPVAKVARYERIQFATLNQCDRSSMMNKGAVLEVQLLADTGDKMHVVASTSTPSLIVRGRSPVNYQEARPAVQYPPKRPPESSSTETRSTSAESSANIFKHMPVAKATPPRKAAKPLNSPVPSPQPTPAQALLASLSVTYEEFKQEMHRIQRNLGFHPLLFE